jgi:hypothetical protein
MHPIALGSKIDEAADEALTVFLYNLPIIALFPDNGLAPCFVLLESGKLMAQ